MEAAALYAFACSADVPFVVLRMSPNTMGQDGEKGDADDTGGARRIG
jgi:nucleoside phosphorylase